MSSLLNKVTNADPMLVGMTGLGLCLGVILALKTSAKKASIDQVEAGGNSSKAKGMKNKKKKSASSAIADAAQEAKQEISSDAPPPSAASVKESPSSSSLLRPAKNQPASILSPAPSANDAGQASDKLSASRVSFASVASSSSGVSTQQQPKAAAAAENDDNASSLGAAAQVPPGSGSNGTSKKQRRVSKSSIVEHSRTAEAVTAAPTASTDAEEHDAEDTQGDESLARRLQAESDGSRGDVNGGRRGERDEGAGRWESVSSSKAARSTVAAAAPAASNGSSRGANGSGGNKFASANPFAVLPSESTAGDSSFSSSKSNKVVDISGGKPSRNSILFSAAASTAPSSGKPSVPGAASTGSQNGSSSAPSKKQRQNANRRDKEKAAKEEAERERLAALARHKKELETEKMKAFNTKQAKGSAGRSGKVVSGGQKASVDERGNLVWS